MNNNKIVLGAVLALVIVIGVVVLMTSSNNTGTNTENVNLPRNTESRDTEEVVPAQEENEVIYKDFKVSPNVLTVKKGTTVTWTNQDDDQHNVTPDTESEDFQSSELFGKGETYKVTFNNVGTYSYHCSPHPYMKGTIEVTE